MRSGEAKIIAVVVPDLDNPFFTSVVSAVEQCLGPEAYEVIVASSHGEEEVEKSRLKAILAWRPAGLIIIPCSDDFAGRQLIEFLKTPYVIADRVTGNLSSDTVSVDNEGAGAIGARHLIDLGHKDILVVASTLSLANIRQRCRGAAEAMRSHGLPEPVIVELGFSIDEASARLSKWFNPDLYERIAPRPTSPFAQALRLSLIEAAPEAAEDPVVVVLSPGSHSETAFDQSYLASLLGFPLVESADLVMRDGKVWMRSLGTLKPIDVVLRRVDAAFVDPLDLRAESRLGVVGLVEAQRRGAVTVVNTLGSGILESPGVMRFLPDLAERLLGETPLLASAPMYWGGIDRERSHLLTHLESLLIRSTVGADPIVGPLLSSAQRDELAARIEATPWQWVGQQPPQFSAAPTDYYSGGLASGSVGMRLFTVSQRGGYAPMIGGLGYVLAQGAGAYTLKTVAAKDVWVQPSTRAGAERVTLAPVDLPTVTPSGTRGVSSPRVLSDLFWTGRYAERAENMARLMTVTRERYHEYRSRQYLDASACAPVLLSALGDITGTDTGADDDHHEMIAVAPTTLWSLTAERGRPGSLAQSIERLGVAARAVRDQMSNDTWMVLAAVDRAVLNQPARPPESLGRADALMASAHARTLSGMLALSGVAAESMVRDVGWTTMDTGKRIERGLWLSALLRSTMTTVRSIEAEQTITESVLVACESSVDLPPAQSRQGQRGRGGRAAAVRRRESAVTGVPARAVARQPARDARGVGIVASRAAPRRDHDAGASTGSRRPRGCRRGRAARRAARPARRRPFGSARAVQDHHRHPAVAARRHAATVGARPAEVFAVRGALP